MNKSLNCIVDLLFYNGLFSHKPVIKSVYLHLAKPGLRKKTLICSLVCPMLKSLESFFKGAKMHSVVYAGRAFHSRNFSNIGNEG